MTSERRDPFAPRPRDEQATGQPNPTQPDPPTSGTNTGKHSPGPFEYHVIPFIGAIKTSPMSKDSMETVSRQLSDTINSMVAMGWEFYRIDQVQLATSPGCLGALFGRKSELYSFDQVIFRRPA